MNNRLVIILIIVGVLLLAVIASSCVNMGRLRSAHGREMATRLDLEEKMSKVAQERVRDEKRIGSLNKALEEEKAAHQSAKKALTEEQAAGQSLKEELNKIAEAKEALEKKLQNLEETGKKAALKTGKK